MGLSKPLLLFCLVIFVFEVSSFQLHTRQDSVLAATSKDGDSSSSGEKVLYARLTTADAKQWTSTVGTYSYTEPDFPEDEDDTTIEQKPDVTNYSGDDETTLETKPDFTNDDSDVEIYSTEKDGILYTTINTYKQLPPELNFIGDLSTCEDDHGKKMDLTIELGKSATEFIKENSKDLLIYMAASCDLSESSDEDTGFPAKPDLSDLSDEDYELPAKPDLSELSDEDTGYPAKPDLSDLSDEDYELPAKPDLSDEDYPAKPDLSESSYEDYELPAKPDFSELSDDDYKPLSKPQQSDESESSDEDYGFSAKPKKSDSSDSSDEDSKSFSKSDHSDESDSSDKDYGFLDKPNH